MWKQTRNLNQDAATGAEPVQFNEFNKSNIKLPPQKKPYKEVEADKGHNWESRPTQENKSKGEGRKPQSPEYAQRSRSTKQRISQKTKSRMLNTQGTKTTWHTDKGAQRLYAWGGGN